MYVTTKIISILLSNFQNNTYKNIYKLFELYITTQLYKRYLCQTCIKVLINIFGQS